LQFYALYGLYGGTVGYDKSAGLAYLSGTDRGLLQTVPPDALDETAISRQPPFLMNYNRREVRPFARRRDAPDGFEQPGGPPRQKRHSGWNWTRWSS